MYDYYLILENIVFKMVDNHVSSLQQALLHEQQLHEETKKNIPPITLGHIYIHRDSNNNILYIGKTKDNNHQKRMDDHIRKANSIKSINVTKYEAYLYSQGITTLEQCNVEYISGIPESELDNTEKTLIQTYKPMFNVVHNVDKPRKRGRPKKSQQEQQQS